MKCSHYHVMGIFTLFFAFTIEASELTWPLEMGDTFLCEDGLPLEDFFGDDLWGLPELPENEKPMEDSFDEPAQLKNESKMQNRNSLFAGLSKTLQNEERRRDRKKRNNISAQKSRLIQETIIKREATHPHLFKYACKSKLKDHESDQLISEINNVMVAFKKQLQDEKGHTIKASNVLCEDLVAQIEVKLAQNCFSTDNFFLLSQELFQKAPCFERVKKVIKRSNEVHRKSSRDAAARTRRRKQKQMAAILKQQIDIKN